MKIGGSPQSGEGSHRADGPTGRGGLTKSGGEEIPLTEEGEEGPGS